MPALSPTMEEGKIAKWLVKEGDAVKSGDILAEIETDKATMEFEAVDEGRIGKLLVPEGAEGIKVNQPIATLLGNEENATAVEKAAPAAAKTPGPPAITVKPSKVAASSAVSAVTDRDPEIPGLQSISPNAEALHEALDGLHLVQSEEGGRERPMTSVI